MTKNQLDNLIQFCFLFHPQCDCNWEMQTPDYLREKWNKYIGVDVTNYEYDKSYFTNNMVNWLKRWNVSNEDFAELKRVIRFISSLSEKPLLKAGRPDMIFKTYRLWTPSEVIENFENQISPVSEIVQTPYNHTHSLIKIEIEKWNIPIENLKFGSILGKGAFGVVMYGEHYQKDTNSDVVTKSSVAIKKLKGMIEAI